MDETIRIQNEQEYIQRIAQKRKLLEKKNVLVTEVTTFLCRTSIVECCRATEKCTFLQKSSSAKKLNA